MKKSQKQIKSYKWRITTLIIITLILFTSLAYNIYIIQIANYDEYKDYAKGDHEKIESDEPYRGEIKDRNGELLVSKEISFRASIIPFYYNRDTNENKEIIIDEIAQVLAFDNESTLDSVSPEKVKREKNLLLKKLDKANKKIKELKINKYEPLLIKDYISEIQAIILLEKADRYPWLTVRPSAKRVYKLEEAYAHIIGFTSPIFESEKEKLLSKPDLYITSSIIGRGGIEREYDIDLRGFIGKKARLRNSKGRFIGKGKERQLVPTKHGEDLYLTIDANIQKAAYLAMGDFKGCVIVSKPSTGEILALVSSPSYDPNAYYKNFKLLLNNPNSPLLNRAISGIYPPGSIFKLIVAASALELNIINPDEEEYICKGYEVIGYDNKIFKCTHIHNKVNLRDAIIKSCNAYFYNLALKVGWKNIYKYGKKFRLGELTGIDLENEVKGYFVNEEWKKENSSMPIWLPGDTANGAIGQGFTAITPIQLHNLISIIANDGYLNRPHLLKKKANIMEDKITFDTSKINYVINKEPIISKTTAKFLKETLRGVVIEKGGTAWRARTSKITPIAGKTGTAQVPNDEEDHALFTCFAPYNTENKDEVIAITVVVENGGFGGVVAAPIATAIIRNVFEGISIEKAFLEMGIPYVPPEKEFQKKLSEKYFAQEDFEDSEYLLAAIQSVVSDYNIDTEHKEFAKNNNSNSITSKTEDNVKTTQSSNTEDRATIANTTKKNETISNSLDNKTKEEIKKETQKREELKEKQETIIKKESEKINDEEAVKEAIEMAGEEDNVYKEEDDFSGDISADPLAIIKDSIEEEAKKILENLENNSYSEDDDDEEEDND